MPSRALIALVAALSPLSPAAAQVNWRRVGSVTSPPPRTAYMMTFDSQRRVIVMFGGWVPGAQSVLSDTWEWDGEDWVQRQPQHVPPARCDAVMAYHVAQRHSVLFGGSLHPGFLPPVIGDTWTWDGDDWTQHAPAPGTAPQARTEAMMAYDASSCQVLLCGGSDLSRFFLPTDTWAWDGVSWTQLSATAPRAEGAVMGHDVDSGTTLLFGDSPIVQPPTTWSWNGTSWQALSLGTIPMARSEASMAFDGYRGTTVMHGGFILVQLTDTWEWQSPGWSQRPTSVTPPPDYYSRAMAFHPGGPGLCLLASGQTWVYGDPRDRRVRSLRVAPRIVTSNGQGSPLWTRTNVIDALSRASDILEREADVALVSERVEFVPDTSGSLYSVNVANLPVLESSLRGSPHWRSDAINIYFVNNIVNLLSRPVAGYASYPGNDCGSVPIPTSEIVVVGETGFLQSLCGSGLHRLRCAGDTLAHEVGHYLKLRHTYESACPQGPEPGISQGYLYAPGACAAGDLVADTPLDPWTGGANAVSALQNIYAVGSVAYDTLLNNLMSGYISLRHAPGWQGGCPTLTAGQRNRINQTLRLDRAHTRLLPGDARTTRLGVGCHPSRPQVSGTVPRLGDLFEVHVSGASAQSPGSLLLGLPGAPFTWANSEIFMDLGTIIEFTTFQTNSDGQWSLAVGLPGSPALLGLAVVTQGVIWVGNIEVTSALLLSLGN